MWYRSGRKERHCPRIWLCSWYLFFFQFADSHSAASFTVFLNCAWISRVVRVVGGVLKVLSQWHLKVFKEYMENLY